MYIVFDKSIEVSEDFNFSRHGKNTATTGSWCRELTVSRISRFLSGMSVEELTETTATIFGVCSHEYSSSYEQSGWKKQYKENPELDQAMLKWFQYTVLLGTGVSLGHTSIYDQSLSRLYFSEKVGMWQNEPPECVQSLVEEIGPEKTKGRGGIYGIPASLLKSPPMFSLLLYLPRLCESLNRNRARLWKLRDLTGGCRFQYRFPRAFETIFKTFAIPTSFTHYGGAEFWTMYYLLSRPPQDSKWLFAKEIKNHSGFHSGIQALFRLKSFPKDVKQFYLDYKNNGFRVLVGTKQISY